MATLCAYQGKLHNRLGVPLQGLKICFIAGTLGIGGAERQLSYIANCLRRRQVQVTVLSLTRDEFWEAELIKAGVPVIWVGKHQNRLLRLIRIIAELAKISPDVIHSHHFYTNLYASIAGIILGKPSVGSSRSDLRYEIEITGRLLGKLSIFMPDILSANSRNSIKLANKFGIPQINLFYIPNAMTAVSSEKLDTEDKTVKVLSVGRLSKEKRFDRLINILNRLYQSGCLGFKAIIIGEGPLREQIVQLAQELNLTPPLLEFRNYTKEIGLAYSEADLLVLTSDVEGTPNVVLEAMAYGLPVVASKVGGVDEIIEQGKTGFLVDPQNEEGFVKVIADLIRDGSLRLRIGEHAKKYIQTNHGMEILEEKLLCLYKVALLKKRPSLLNKMWLITKIMR